MESGYKVIGGTGGHWLRRCLHFGIAIVPYLYYWQGNNIANFIDLSRELIIGNIVVLILVLEVLRLWFGWTVFGQRSYEQSQISAFAWGGFSVGVTLLLAPKIGINGAAIGAPLIWSLSLIDPLLGEARNHHLKPYWVVLLGLVGLTVIWVSSAILFGTPWWILPFVIPITLLSEWPRLGWIDDNATMLFGPLCFILIIKLFFSSLLT